MKLADSPCDHAEVQALLVDDLSQTQVIQLEAHLQHCPSCQSVLQSHAATDQTWEDARDYLRDDDDDLERIGDSPLCSEMPAGAGELIDALAPSDDPRMMGRLGPYEISGVIGAGGMGIVLKGFDTSLNRFVAIKVLAPRLWQDESALLRFSREARAAASIVHDNVIEIYGVADAATAIQSADQTSAAKIPYFTMPYLPGDSIQKRLDRSGAFAPREILRIAEQIARGLQVAHSRGLVHRDIKPANILLSDGSERVRITDFGLAHSPHDSRLTQTGVVAGTPAYMSPEQVHGDPIDHRSDLFSLGSVMYAMATGRPPFAADSEYGLLNQVATATTTPVTKVNPAIPDWLAGIILRLHALSPKDRYQSAAQLASDLQNCLAHLEQPDSFSQPRHVTKLAARYRKKVRPSASSRRWFSGMAGGFVVVLAGWWFSGPLAQLAGQGEDSPIDVTGSVIDSNNEPLQGVTVLAIQKTWPNQRYRQRSLTTTTDKDGNFRFKEFAVEGKPYAFLLTALPDQHSMASFYLFKPKGKKHEPVTLRVERAEPVTLTVSDSQGNPVEGLEVLPSTRNTADGVEHFTYTMQIKDAGVKTDAKGIVKFSAWQPGETGSLTLRMNDKVTEQDIKIPTNRSVTLTYDRPPASNQPAAVAVSVAGKVVDDSGQPISDAKVLVVRKLWPNNRFRQDALQTTTDASGEFQLKDFAPGKEQYAVLLTIVEDGYALTSSYRLVRDGSQQDPVTLTLEPAAPVTFRFVDRNGQPVKGLKAHPAARESSDSSSHINYFLHAESTEKTSDAKGEIQFFAWKAGETGALRYEHEGANGTLEFQVGDDRAVELKLE